MKRILKDNPNTKEHWIEEYNKNGGAVAVTQGYRYEIIARYIADIPCDVVDLGCGTGVCNLFIKGVRPKARLTGVDLSGIGRDIKLSKEGEKDIVLFENFVEGDVCKTGLPSNYFDYAISSEVLEHLDEPQKMVDEMYRILKPTGKAILTTPYLNRLPSGEHVWEFDFKDVADMFKAFKRVWAFPYASGGEGRRDDGSLANPAGTWDEIFVLASKSEII